VLALFKTANTPTVNDDQNQPFGHRFLETVFFFSLYIPGFRTSRKIRSRKKRVIAIDEDRPAVGLKV
jgi:hypothetical protein